MRKNILCLFLLAVCSLNAQVFWSESFGTGCSQGNLANGFNGSNGTWIVTQPNGGNDPEANEWFVSATEAGMLPPNCGSGCGFNPTLTNQTLHIGNVSTSPSASFSCPTGDCGALYDTGGGCGFGLGCVITDKRAESPVINCSGKSGIALRFVYIMGGQPPALTPGDQVSVWYFDGTTWSLLIDPPVTNNSACGGVGRWTAFSVALPVSADNNPNVKIGFEWVNNDDGGGSDPSIAVDDIILSENGPPMPLPNLCGIWFGYGYTCYTNDSTGNFVFYPIPVEIINIKQDSLGLIEAIKITGDSCVPAGDTSWHGTISDDGFGLGFNLYENVVAGSPSYPSCCVVPATNPVQIYYTPVDSIGTGGPYGVYFIRATCDQIDSMGLNLDSLNPDCQICLEMKLSDLKSRDEYLVYPNPTAGEIFITSVSDKSSILSFDLLDVCGKKTNCIFFKCDDNEWKGDISLLQDGIYFLKISSQDKTLCRTFKILKN